LRIRNRSMQIIIYYKYSIKLEVSSGK
jgi:hypothetical protein